MKAHQFGILFTILALLLFFTLDIKIRNVKTILDENNKMDLILTSAIDDGVEALAESYTERKIVGSKEDGVNVFVASLYTSLGIESDPITQQKIRMYLPIILITEKDGFYIFHNDEYEVGGITSVVMRWSEKFKYSYEDNDFIYNFSLFDDVEIYDKNRIITERNPYMELDYHEFSTSDYFKDFRRYHPDHFLLDDSKYYEVKKGVIIKEINEKMSFYINQHNKLAANYGITYNFSLPVIDESELIRSIEQPGMIVIFQGYPLKITGEIYNRVEVAGAQIFQKEVYYIEEKGWYKLYHKESCEECKSNPNIDKSMIYYKIIDCVKQGAYGCEKCTQGVHVPEYHIH